MLYTNIRTVEIAISRCYYLNLPLKIWNILWFPHCLNCNCCVLKEHFSLKKCELQICSCLNCNFSISFLSNSQVSNTKLRSNSNQFEFVTLQSFSICEFVISNHWNYNQSIPNIIYGSATTYNLDFMLVK